MYLGKHARRMTGGGIHVEGLVTIFHGRAILDGISLDIAEGTVVGLMGPNGSGKSTLIKTLCGLYRPSRGTGTVCGAPLGGTTAPECGIMFETPPFMEDKSGRVNLSLLAGYGARQAADAADIDARMERVGLDPANKTPVKSYSQGMRKRLGLAQALLGTPKLLLLDEPMNGLDPEGVVMIRHAMREFADNGGIVLVSSHLLHELELSCDRVFLLMGGKLKEVPFTHGADGELERFYLERVAGATAR